MIMENILSRRGSGTGRPESAGFTLLELLSVIAIVTLTAAIVLPALQIGRDAAKQAICFSNLRQTHHAQAVYEQDFGRYAAWWSQADPVSWRVRLRDHALAETRGAGSSEDADAPAGVFLCPEVTHAELNEAGGDPSKGQFGSGVAVNGLMHFPQWNFASHRVPMPDRIILLGDQPVELYETMLSSDSYGVWGGELGSGWYRATGHRPERGYRHLDKTGAPIAFVDGHVGRLEDASLRRASGHWYWWDALENDTASPSPNGDPPNVSFPPIDSPRPTPTPSGGGPLPPGGGPTGPLTLPCGCPVP